jgi:hypothetical protein
MLLTYEDNLEQHLLVHLHELLVPLIDVGGLAAVIIVIGSALGVVLVVLTPLDDLLQNGLVDLQCDGQR